MWATPTESAFRFYLLAGLFIHPNEIWKQKEKSSCTWIMYAYILLFTSTGSLARETRIKINASKQLKSHKILASHSVVPGPGSRVCVCDESALAHQRDSVVTYVLSFFSYQLQAKCFLVVRQFTYRWEKKRRKQKWEMIRLLWSLVPSIFDESWRLFSVYPWCSFPILPCYCCIFCALYVSRNVRVCQTHNTTQLWLDQSNSFPCATIFVSSMWFIRNDIIYIVFCFLSLLL